MSKHRGQSSAHQANHRQLLGKSPKGKFPGRSLFGHTLDVFEAFEALFGTFDEPSALANCWARFFRLDGTQPFLVNGRAAAAYHDWGKANDGFQGMLLGKCRQLLRHEQLSAVLMTRPKVWEWLGTNSKFDRELILSAVVGHHLKARDVAFGQPEAEFDTLLRMRWDDEDLRHHLSEMAARLELVGPVPEDIPKLWSFEPTDEMGDLDAALFEVKDRLEAFGEALEEDNPRLRLLWAVRAGLIAADSAGSGLVREHKPVTKWIGEAFDPGQRLDGAAVDQKVIEPRVKKMKETNPAFKWNSFQDACAVAEQVPERALLLAPCGSGKTLAAWRWIAARCAEQARGRVIFLYPTRGTATEGYRDYVSYAGPEEAALVHGTAELELADIHPDIKDEDRIAEARLFALQQWPKRLFSATVDQFLGFLQYGYGPICHLPLLADSVVVFDEVHSYDRGMFSALLQFLEHFDLPVLCMTATLGERRQRQLAEQGLKIVNGLDFDHDGGRLKTIADYDRYRITVVPDAATAEARVQEALKDKRRVLWVVNTVDRAQDIARRFAENADATKLPDGGLRTADGVPVHCYHSRYRLDDRKARHDAVVSAFKPKDGDHGGVLAVTTQVCEMSLDLDADVLVTEYAPATSLVQRMGRCCRDTNAHETGRVGQVILYAPTDDAGQRDILPYTKRDMLGVDDFVAGLESTGLVSQSRLEDLLAAVPHAADLPKECRFIHSGPWASMGEENFRDIDQANRPAVIDALEYRDLRRGPRPWDAQSLIVPVPRKFARPHAELPSWLSVADGGYYRPGLGYCTKGSPGPTIP